MAISFLTFEEVIHIHENQIRRFVGLSGIRDSGLLESALSLPQSTFNNTFLHEDIFEMAAAYCFAIIKNHPFADGNKRTGILSALLFLEYNGFQIDFSQDEFFDLVINIATSAISLSEIAALLRKNHMDYTATLRF